MIITTRGTLGNVAIYDETVPFDVVRINSGMLILRVDTSVIWQGYLSLFIQSPVFIDQLEEQRTGSAQPQIPARILKTFIVPTPSIEEQKRIVAKVDQLMALCDQLETKLKQTQITSEKLVAATVAALAA